MSCLSEDGIYQARDATTAPAQDACKEVEDKRDLRNSSPLHHRVQSFFSTQMQDTNVLTDYIFSYEQELIYITELRRSAHAESPYRHLLAYIKYNETTARHLLMSLPSCRVNIVAKLQFQNFLTYVDVRSRLLELSGPTNLSSNGKALNTQSHKIYNFNNKKMN